MREQLKGKRRATMVFDHILIEDRKFVLDSDHKLREVTLEIGRPCSNSASHCCLNDNHFSEGEKEL